MQTSTDYPDSDLHQLQYQLAAIQEQQHLQTFLIEQFHRQLKSYQTKQAHGDQQRTKFSSSSDGDEDRSTLSPLDLSSTSIKSDEDQSTSLIQFQMESHEGEPENPHMSKVRWPSISPTHSPAHLLAKGHDRTSASFVSGFSRVRVH
jgi:hypothetical protein